MVIFPNSMFSIVISEQNSLGSTQTVSWLLPFVKYAYLALFCPTIPKLAYFTFCFFVRFSIEPLGANKAIYTHLIRYWFCFEVVY